MWWLGGRRVCKTVGQMCSHPLHAIFVAFLSCFIWSLFKNIHRWLKTVGIEQPQKLSFSLSRLPTSPRPSLKIYPFSAVFIQKPFFTHKRLTLFIPAFSGLFRKRRPPTLFLSPSNPSADCSAFHIFLPPTPDSLTHDVYFYTYFSKFKTILLGQAAIFVG